MKRCGQRQSHSRQRCGVVFPTSLQKTSLTPRSQTNEPERAAWLDLSKAQRHVCPGRSSAKRGTGQTPGCRGLIGGTCVQKTYVNRGNVVHEGGCPPPESSFKLLVESVVSEVFAFECLCRTSRERQSMARARASFLSITSKCRWWQPSAASRVGLSPLGIPCSAPDKKTRGSDRNNAPRFTTMLMPADLNLLKPFTDTRLTTKYLSQHSLRLVH